MYTCVYVCICVILFDGESMFNVCIVTSVIAIQLLQFLVIAFVLYRVTHVIACYNWP